ncbi:MAG: hypothetical protein D3923_10755 [Candidatus Electrothrix sp. AR3]|nr:hypothetical protein [Candidatus Electrothrix sp. AR3]
MDLQSSGSIEYAGFCSSCQQEHTLAADGAYQAAIQLMAVLKLRGRIDFDQAESNPLFSTEYLFGPARGKMFGVMTARAPDGRMMTVRAFSGQYNGIWQVAGWVKPVFELRAFHQIHDEEEKIIKAMGQQINELPDGSVQRKKCILLRKQRSQRLMKNIHALYQLRNFQGQVNGFEEIFPTGMGIPSGTGDCCAPKLLQYAANHALIPQGLAEFYWGRENASGTRQHGCFYPSCREKCQPILGFMLCGLAQS